LNRSRSITFNFAEIHFMSNPYPSSNRELPARGTSGKAIASLVCGIASLVVCPVTGIPAIFLGMMGLGDIKRSEGAIGGRGLALGGIVTGIVSTALTVLAVIGVLLGLLLPAVSMARNAARRVATANQLRQIAAAIHQYEIEKGHLPWAAESEEGKPPVSWRVRILPYLEEKPLYDQYHLDEAWDSVHNRTLVDLMPKVFKSLENPNEVTGNTDVVAIVGEGTMWASKPPRLSDIRDGSSNTVMLVEAQGLDIPWTDPRDMSIEMFSRGINAPGGPKGYFPGVLLAAFADGSVSPLDDDTSGEDLHALATANGGEDVSHVDRGD
jgi:hypothetical protein